MPFTNYIDGDVIYASHVNDLGTRLEEFEVGNFTNGQHTHLSAATGGLLTFPVTSTATLAFGSTLVPDKSFTVVDAGISATSKIIPAISWISGFARDMDEIWADPIVITCKPAAGSMTVYAQAITGRVSGDYPLVYSVAS